MLPKSKLFSVSTLLLALAVLTAPGEAEAKAKAAYSVIRYGNPSGTEPTSVTSGPGGFLYVTFANDGPNGYGSLVQMDQTGLSPQPPFQVFHAFEAGNARPYTKPVLASDGKFYGISWWIGHPGMIYRLDSNGSNFTTIYEIGSPLFKDLEAGSIIEGRDGRLYVKGTGGILAVGRDGTNPQVIFQAPARSESSDRDRGTFFSGSDGRLYGVITSHDYNESSDRSTAFVIDPDGANYRVLYATSPTAIDSLFEGRDGLLYGSFEGSTEDDGDSPFHPGRIFSMNKDGSNFSTIRKFEKGATIGSGYLFEGRDNLLYLSTYSGLYSLKKNGAELTEVFAKKRATVGTPLVEISPLIFVGIEGGYPGFVYKIDASLPGVTVTGPRKFSTRASRVKITGQATGSVSRVEYRAHGHRIRKAHGTKKWSFIATLPAGLRSNLRVRAISTSGRPSAWEYLYITRLR